MPRVLATTAAVGGVGTVAALTSGDKELFGKGRSFYAGLGVGIAGALAIKTGVKHLPNMGVMAAMNRIPGGPIGKFAAATAVGTVPSLALLTATSGDRTLLGQGHEFWTGAVWGLAGVALLKTAIPLSNLKTHGPLALGWVASDFAALGINAAMGGGSKDAAH